MSDGVERHRGVSGLKARGDGRRDTNAGRESPQGSAFTTPTRSYGDQGETERAWPTHSTSTPVAIGSSVPQWPTFFTPIRRAMPRTRATTSKDVYPRGLSTRRTMFLNVSGDSGGDGGRTNVGGGLGRSGDPSLGCFFHVLGALGADGGSGTSAASADAARARPGAAGALRGVRSRRHRARRAPA